MEIYSDENRLSNPDVQLSTSRGNNNDVAIDPICEWEKLGESLLPFDVSDALPTRIEKLFNESDLHHSQNIGVSMPLALATPLARKDIQIQRYSCPICSKVFMVKSNLNRHIKNVHDSETFICEKCDKSFGRKDSLKKHIRKFCSNSFM
jgi:uncharacterized Zn-finger protein